MAVAGAVGLAEEINSALRVLASHRPYWESDHVLNIALNALCGGVRLEDIEARRNDAVFLDGRSDSVQCFLSQNTPSTGSSNMSESKARSFSSKSSQQSLA
jgi:hypothetical protein